MIKFLFGEIDLNKVPDILLPLLFFVTLFSATCFFFDAHKLSIVGQSIYFPVGLLFFPATYVISNIIQNRSGRATANTVVACGFFADLILVTMSWLIAHAGDRHDYLSVFNGLPVIMGATFIFLSVSSLLNIFIFECTKKMRKRSLWGLFFSFFSSITFSELLVSSMSMPLLFEKEGFSRHVFVTIVVTVIYKILFNFLATITYIYCNKYRCLRTCPNTKDSNLTKITKSSVYD